jgi:hypothetical protein
MATREPPLPRVVVYVCPQATCDLVPYLFYRHAPSGYLLDVRHVPVKTYDPEHGRTLLGSLSRSLLRDPVRTERVVIGGSAFSLSFSWDELQATTAAASGRLGVSVSTDMMAVVSQVRRLGSPVVVVHRLAGVTDTAITGFLESAGIDCVGVLSAGAIPADNADTPLDVGAAQATRLAERALERHEAARTVVLLGGSWWTYGAQASIESTGRSVVNNVLAFAEDLAIEAAANHGFARDLTT